MNNDQQVGRAGIVYSKKFLTLWIYSPPSFMAYETKQYGSFVIALPVFQRSP
jgi:hypothetical protein